MTAYPLQPNSLDDHRKFFHVPILVSIIFKINIVGVISWEIDVKNKYRKLMIKRLVKREKRDENWEKRKREKDNGNEREKVNDCENK